MVRSVVFWMLALLCVWGDPKAEITREVFEKLLHTIKPKDHITLFTYDTYLNEVLVESKMIRLTDDPTKADFVALKRVEEFEAVKRALKGSNARPLWVALDYKLFKYNEEFVAAFYWRKSRKQLLFLTPRLKREGVKLTPDFDRYILDSL